MISYIDPIVELMPNPEGIDKAIQEIQQSIASEIGWIEKVYGRALAQRRKDEANPNRDIIFPEVYNKREPFSLMPNDNIGSFSFFHPLDPATFTSVDFGNLEQAVTQPVDLIVWVNLFKLDPLKDYNFVEELKLQMIHVLNSQKNFSITQSFHQWDRVFAPFTITDTFRTYLKPPYAAFKITGNLTYIYKAPGC